MSTLQALLSKLFKSNQSQKAEQPFIKEAITDLAAYSQYANLFESSPEWLDIRVMLRAVFFDKIPHREIAYWKDQGIHGIVLYCRDFPNMHTSQWIGMLTYWQQVITDQGYVKQLSEVQSRQRGESIEQQTRFYLKPSIYQAFDNPKEGFDQRFGNVELTFNLKDDLPYNLTLKVMYYNDHKYRYPLPFEILMEQLV